MLDSSLPFFQLRYIHHQYDLDFPLTMTDLFRIRNVLIPAAIGLIVFLAFTGGHGLNPLRVDWIMSSDGDAPQQYVGWNFFRHSPYLQFPLGLNPGYGEVIGSSIVFSDSIPLLAILFKLVRGVLPDQFQYFGLWIAACFALQAVFAWAILSLRTTDNVIKALGCALLTLSPPMLWRLHGHEALIGHWLLLAALYLYLTNRGRMWHWILLICVTASIHAYLLAMVAGIWFADRVRLLAPGSSRLKQLAVELPCLAVAVLITTWSVGYYTVRSVVSGGFGTYRVTLTSPFRAEAIWSIWSSYGFLGGDYEGFCYIGAGVLLLFVTTAVLIIKHRKNAPIAWGTHASLIFVCALFYLFALSNRVSLGGRHELFQYPMPAFLTGFTSTFRASGRFIWPVFYAAIVFLLFRFIKLSPRKWVVPLLCVFVVFQATDLIKASKYFRSQWTQQWTPSLTSDFWKEVPRQYKRIAFVMPLDGGYTYVPIAFMASNAKMTINGGNLARVDFDKLGQVQAQLQDTIEHGTYSPDTLYVFHTPQSWATAKANFKGDGFVGTVDNYDVIAPGWHGCTTSCGALANK
ncbi:hypothetical protein F6X40_36155 [Paraburkholderia sp. UCT31]|uniref:DUF6311 domain-containing protein n=1 Tax=Paraburkholderia sp. UCT31 TaxID=2615209 RepID=UPI0016550030|nr:DUF6311 domain-containing protein [Paraburkholderia sp. UCT31]MBC8741977.1 hypothetical protein [Paraburkholderia sp. UCT31]